VVVDGVYVLIHERRRDLNFALANVLANINIISR